MTKPLTPLALLTSFLLILTACGGGGGGSSSPLSTAISSTITIQASSEASADLALLQKGKAFYQQQCAVCHDGPALGLDGSGTFKIDAAKFSSMQALASFIDANMPSGNASACIGECANATAAFIGNNYRVDTDANTSAMGNSSMATNIPSAPQSLQKITPVTLHRLTRSEYNNTVRDLFSTKLRPGDNFPEDDFGYGFNNIADVLSTSLVHVEEYNNAANTLLTEALSIPAKSSSTLYKLADYGSENGTVLDDLWLQWANGTVTVPVTLTHAGIYTVNIVAGQHAAGSENANLAVSLNGILLKNITVAAAANNMQAYRFEVQLNAGENSIELAFTNDYWVPDVADRDLLLSTLELTGPKDFQEPTPSLAALSCPTTLVGVACAREIVKNVGLRAWRRPLTSNEISDLSAFYDLAKSKGNSHNDSLRPMLKALLLSPNFIYRPEMSTSTVATPLNAYELASRLSYFLWSSMPDEQLFQAAADNSLLDPKVLSSEVERMLNDVKSASLVENFAVQWLKFDKVTEANPDIKLFPSFNPSLVAAMRQETRLFLQDMLKNNLPVSTLLTADYTYLNQTLAQHYGVAPAIKGDTFQRFVWPTGAAHRGILGQASVLTATSHSTSTSPVLRGKWVLENLLCDEPPPPPPGVQNIAQTDSVKNLSTRQRFEAHSKSGSTCIACHQSMDPIGFGLENFNAVGQFRTMDLQYIVDSSGKLPSGETFNGSVELSNILARSYRLPMCTTEHLLTFALGRGVDALGYGGEKPDYPIVYNIYQKTAANGHKIRDIIKEIVLSELFLNHAAASEAGSIAP